MTMQEQLLAAFGLPPAALNSLVPSGQAGPMGPQMQQALLLANPKFGPGLSVPPLGAVIPSEPQEPGWWMTAPPWWNLENPFQPIQTTHPTEGVPGPGTNPPGDPAPFPSLPSDDSDPPGGGGPDPGTVGQPEPAPVTPDPVVVEPTPVVTEPAPVVTEPAPVAPDPVVTQPPAIPPPVIPPLIIPEDDDDPPGPVIDPGTTQPPPAPPPPSAPTPNPSGGGGGGGNQLPFPLFPAPQDEEPAPEPQQPAPEQPAPQQPTIVPQPTPPPPRVPTSLPGSSIFGAIGGLLDPFRIDIRGTGGGFEAELGGVIPGLWDLVTGGGGAGQGIAGPQPNSPASGNNLVPEAGLGSGVPFGAAGGYTPEQLRAEIDAMPIYTGPSNIGELVATTAAPRHLLDLESWVPGTPLPQSVIDARNNMPIAPPPLPESPSSPAPFLIPSGRPSDPWNFDASKFDRNNPEHMRILEQYLGDQADQYTRPVVIPNIPPPPNVGGIGNLGNIFGGLGGIGAF